MAPASDSIHSLGELQAVVGQDPRFGGFAVTAGGDGWFELRAGDAGLVLAAAPLAADAAALEPHRVRSESGKTMLVFVGSDGELDALPALREPFDFGVLDTPISRARLYLVLKNHLELAQLRGRDAERGRVARRYEYELSELISISRALSSERDIHTLLSLILEKSRYITGADAGSVYIVEGAAANPRERTLRFMVSQNDSVPIDFSEYSLPVDDKSVVGRAVISRQLINIPNLEKVQSSRRFDETSGYRSRSMLTVPMVNQHDEVIGVIQLINRRKEGAPKLRAPLDFAEWVIPFETREEELSATLAAQAGISLENTLLYEDIRKLFEGFVNASVTAIESRDPTTSGHSQRVATLTVGLGELIDRQTTGKFAAVRFTPDDLKEIEYAALLHDFGKVGVRERVLVKAKKLYEEEREQLLARFDFIRQGLELDGLKAKLELALREGPDAARLFAALEADAAARRKQLDEFMAFVLRANEPAVLAEGGFERLSEIAAQSYVDARGERRPYLTAAEVDALKLPRGSLTAIERLEIESHVTHTYNFLKTIPWGRRLGDIPAIAGSHHEKLDGTGYPKGLRGEEIRIESRMMTIADIFDALTASDRPYKKAMPAERALDILGFEVKEGKCDPELLRIFVESKVWQRVLSG